MVSSLRLQNRVSCLLFTLVAVVGFSPAQAAEEGQERAQSLRHLQASVRGDLGQIPVELFNDKQFAEEATRDYRLPEPVMRALDSTGNEIWRLRRWWEDEQGRRHFRMKQYINGLEVVGGEVIIHASPAGDVETVDVQFLSSRDVPVESRTTARGALESAVRHYKTSVQTTEDPSLCYLRTTDGRGFLVWRLTVTYTGEDGGPQRDEVRLG